jgi:AcrR family transcriptional regulator
MPGSLANRSSARRHVKASKKRVRTRRNPEQRKLEIVDAAYDIFTETGYYESTVADIAERVGISKGTFYLYFESKFAIFDYLVNEKLALLLVEANVAEDPEDINTLEDHLAALRRVAERLVDVFLEDPQLAQLMFFGSIAVSPELKGSVDKAIEFAADLTERYFKNGSEKGFIREDLDTRALSHGVNALIATAGRQICSSERPKETASAMIDLFMTLIHNGAAVPTHTPSAGGPKPPTKPKSRTAKPSRRTA